VVRGGKSKEERGCVVVEGTWPELPNSLFAALGGLARLLYAYFPSPAYNDRSRDYVPTILAARPKQNIKTSETMNGERVSHRSDRVDIRI